jgi:Crinkler effector protein N-terminal domain
MGIAHSLFGPPPDTGGSNFTLYCWVAGDPPHSIFRLKIKKTAMVGDLADAIKLKKQHQLASDDPDNLIIWKVSIPLLQI